MLISGDGKIARGPSLLKFSYATLLCSFLCLKNPTYELVSSGKTDYAETLKIRYNPKLIDFEGLLKYFFTIHDSTTQNRQGKDVGRQYRSIVFYSNNKEKNIYVGTSKKWEFKDLEFTKKNN